MNEASRLVARLLSGFACVGAVTFATCMGLVFPQPLGAQVQLDILHSFNDQTEGRLLSGLTEGTDRSFYGTSVGGTTTGGSIVKIDPSGVVTVLHQFVTDDVVNGWHPSGKLLQGSDGNFYGVATSGGTFVCGTIFKVSPAGAFTVLHSFNGSDGCFPDSALIQAADGYFYGVTGYGGAYNLGVAFRMSGSGDVTLLHSFGGGASDGANPGAALIEATDGNLYGTTNLGGTTGWGTVFRMSRQGSLVVLRSLAAFDGGHLGWRVDGVIQARDGNLYGTVRMGSEASKSEMFRLTLSGTYTTLRVFDRTDGIPYGSLLQATDGNFYGTVRGGVYASDRIYVATPAGQVTLLWIFSPSEGSAPSTLIEARDHNLYGTTSDSGFFGGGSAYRFRVATLQPRVTLTVTTERGATSTANLSAGTATLWTAAASGAGTLPYQYQFWIYSAAGWTMVQDYSLEPRLRWTPAHAGTYTVQVWVRNAGSLTNWDAYQGAAMFVVGIPNPVALAALTTTPSLPRQTGDMVTWSATATGGVGPLQYQFWLMEPGSGWRVLQEWSASNTTTWTPLTSGDYAAQVWVRSASSTAVYEAWRGTGTFRVASGPLRVTVAADRSLPIVPGATMTWRATTSGGDGTALDYQFWRYSYETRTWTVARSYAASAQWTWTPTPADIGRYALQVWTRRQGSAAPWEAWTGTPPFSVEVLPLSVTLTSNQGNPPAVPAGTPITWRAQTAGATDGVEYAFWRYDGRTRTWTNVQPYGASDTYLWTPAPADVGPSALQVWVHAIGSAPPFDAWVGTGYFIIQP